MSTPAARAAPVEVPPKEQLKERQALFVRIEKLRGGRTLVCLTNFDRDTDSGLEMLGVRTQFNAESKESLFRVLKESKPTKGVDLCVYTRGGDTNSVWPLVSLVREFDKNFEVLVPFRCHSAGTLLSLGARRIVMTPLSELSPVDPSTGNQFNPADPFQKGARLGIAVEDVRAYGDFLTDLLARTSKGDGLEAAKERLERMAPEQRLTWVQPLLSKLVENVHPLALGNVHRVHQQIKNLASCLLRLHPLPAENPEAFVDKAIHAFTTKFNSHLHMINRHEAKEILGDRVELADDALAVELDSLMRLYEDHFELRRPLIVGALMGDTLRQDFRCIGGVVESAVWSYLHETAGVVSQASVVPPNIQIQLPPGQPMPLIPGLPRQYNLDIKSRRWMRNTEPKGITR